MLILMSALVFLLPYLYPYLLSETRKLKVPTSVKLQEKNIVFITVTFF